MVVRRIYVYVSEVFVFIAKEATLREIVMTEGKEKASYFFSHKTKTEKVREKKKAYSKSYK